MNDKMQISNFFIMFRDSFKSMRLGETRWLTAIIKREVMFLLLRPFSLPDYLNSKFDKAESKSGFIWKGLINNTE